MDPLSFTASIISVGTLAVQCADSLRKASAFWSSIQDAPKDIDRLSQESSLLANIFDDIERDFNLGQIPSQMHDNYVIVMRLAQEDLKELTDLVDKLSDKLASSTSAIKQHWAKLQIALKDEKISKMRKKLQRVESMIHTLELRSLKSMLSEASGQCSIRILQAHTHTVAAGSHRQLEPSAMIFPSKEAQAGRKNRLIQTSHFYSSINFLLGALSLRKSSSTFTISQNGFRGDTEATKEKATIVRSSYVIQLLMGITSCRRGFKLSISDSFDTWTLNAVRQRSSDSEVFDLCYDDDADGVESLLLRGEASIHDIDEFGDSLLHNACLGGSEKVCRLLLKYGCDMYLSNQRNMIPLQYGDPSDGYITAFSEAGFDFCEDGYQLGLIPDNIHLWRLILAKDFFLLRRAQIYYWVGWLEHCLLYSPGMAIELTGFVIKLIRDVDDPNITFGAQHQIFSILALNWLRSCLAPPPSDRSQDCCTRQETVDINADLLSRAFEALPLLYNYDTLQNYLQSALDGDHWITSMVYVIAVYDCGNVPGLKDMLIAKWLEFLQNHGIDLKVYGMFEQRRIRDYFPSRSCCRVITAQVSYNDDTGLVIKVSNELRPEFSHLDTRYLCEPYCPRYKDGPAMCLSLVDESLRNIKLNSNIPGQWEEPLKPNEELVLQNRGLWGGFGFYNSVDERYPVFEQPPSGLL